jgi:hypothetical protein
LGYHHVEESLWFEFEALMINKNKRALEAPRKRTVELEKQERSWEKKQSKGLSSAEME